MPDYTTSSPPQPRGWRIWWIGARPATLAAAVVPVIVGTAASVGTRLHVVAVDDSYPPVPVWGRDYSIRWANAVAALIVALALQIATNYANDYSDGRRGTDDPRQRIGPTRLVGSGLATADQVRMAMLCAFGVALCAGAFLAIDVGWELVPVGVAAVAAGWFYTGGARPYGYAGFGELFVFVFFGLVATVGSTYVQIERVTLLSVGCGVAVGSFATALLVVNNLRDIPGDTQAGKLTLAVRLGDRRTRVFYVVLMVVPFLLLPFVAGLSGRPLGSLAFLALLLSTRGVRDVLGGASGAALIPVLQRTGRVQLLYGALLTFGLCWIIG